MFSFRKMKPKLEGEKKKRRWALLSIYFLARMGNGMVGGGRPCQKVIDGDTCSLVQRLPVFLLAIARTISNGFASGARFESLWLCLPIVAG